jgi:hypothetical protein
MSYNGAFIVDDCANGSVPTFNTEATGYAGSNIYNGIPSEVWRTTGVSGVVTYAFDSTQTISAVAVINSNLTSASSGKVEFSDDSFSTVAETETFSCLSTFYHSFEAKSYTGIKFTFSKNSGYVEIGELVIGTLLELNPSYYYEYRRLFRENRDGDIMTKGGQYFQSAVSEQIGYQLDVKLYPESEFGTLRKLYRAGGKVFIPNLNETDCYYGVVTDLQMEANTRRYGTTGYMDYSLTFWQQPNVFA